MLSILLLCHFLVVVQFNLLDDHEIMPIDVFCHLTVLQIGAILTLFKFGDTLLVIKVGLTLLTSASTLLDPRLAICKGLDSLERLTLRLDHTAVRLNERCEV